MIPFPAPVFTPEKLLEVLILNYFFPLLSGHLEIDVNGEVVNQSNLREMTEKYANKKIPDAEALFSFIEAVYSHDPEDLIKAKQYWHDSGKMSEQSFIAVDMETLRARYSEGDLIGVTLPIKITKDDQERRTHFNVFLQKPESIGVGMDMYVRGALMIPGERKFSHRKAYGVLLAKEPLITEFLGDAENPAHTKWNGSADKLKNYSKAPETLRAIRNSVVQLYDLLAQSVETEMKDPLRDFSSLSGVGKMKEHRRKRKKIDPPPPPPPSTPKPIRVETTENGFNILPNGQIEPDDFPVLVKISVAYNRPDGSAFRRYNRLDFDLGSPAFTINQKNITVTEAKDNVLSIQINGSDFDLQVDGFDRKREPIVKVNF